MKTLKILLFVALALCSLGCKTVTDSAGVKTTVIDTNRTDRAANILRSTTSAAALLVVAHNPEEAAYFRLAANTIDTALTQDGANLVTLQKSLASIRVKELKTPLAQIATVSALGLFETFAGDSARKAINGNYIASTLLAAVRDGIRDAIQKDGALKTWRVDAVPRDYMPIYFGPNPWPIGGKMDTIPVGIYGGNTTLEYRGPPVQTVFFPD